MSTIKVDTIQNTSGVQQYTAQITATMNGTGLLHYNSLMGFHQ